MSRHAARTSSCALHKHKGEQHTPQYLALNPKGQVPLLVVDGQPLNQIVAICDPLDRIQGLARQSGPFLLGERVSFVDAFALTFLRWGGFGGIDPASLPDYRAYVARVAAQPPVAAAMAREDARALKTAAQAAPEPLLRAIRPHARVLLEQAVDHPELRDVLREVLN